MDRKCPACGTSKNTNIGEKWNFNFVRCCECGTLFTKEYPAPNEQQDYDDYGYSRDNNLPEFIDRRCDELIKPFEAYRKLNRFLDVGFGAGTIIRAASRAGWAVSGVEVSKAAVHALARWHPEFDLHSGLLESQGFQDDAFDAVSIVEVIEHVINPLPILNETYRILRPGGIAWVTTPNLKSLSWKLLGLHWSMVAPPDHLEIYSLNGVRKLLEHSGFRVKRIDTYGLNPFEIVNYYRRGRKEITVAERLNSGYDLNESLEAGKLRKLTKKGINEMLNILRWGDGIKVWAEKLQRN